MNFFFFERWLKTSRLQHSCRLQVTVTVQLRSRKGLFYMQDSGFRHQGFRVQGSGFRVQASRLQASGMGLIATSPWFAQSPRDKNRYRAFCVDSVGENICMSHSCAICQGDPTTCTQMLVPCLHGHIHTAKCVCRHYTAQDHAQA